MFLVVADQVHQALELCRAAQHEEAALLLDAAVFDLLLRPATTANHRERLQSGQRTIKSQQSVRIVIKDPNGRDRDERASRPDQENNNNNNNIFKLVAATSVEQHLFDRIYSFGFKILNPF